MKQHKHAELIKAWADGAEIEALYEPNDGFRPDAWQYTHSPVFYENKKYRIKPGCEYAIEKIRELGGDEAVDLYLYWLDGGEIEIVLNDGADEDWEDLDPPSNNPFMEFADCYNSFKYRKKKRKVKQVLWIRCVHSTGINRKWIQEGNEIECPDWHKVPTCTREVEVDQ